MRKLYRQHLGPCFSEGTRLLWLKLIRDDLELEDVNRAIKGSRGWANQIMYGDRPASVRVAVALEKAFGVPVEAWGKKPSRPFETPAKRAAA